MDIPSFIAAFPIEIRSVFVTRTLDDLQHSFSGVYSTPDELFLWEESADALISWLCQYYRNDARRGEDAQYWYFTRYDRLPFNVTLQIAFRTMRNYAAALDTLISREMDIPVQDQTNEINDYFTQEWHHILVAADIVIGWIVAPRPAHPRSAQRFGK